MKLSNFIILITTIIFMSCSVQKQEVKPLKEEINADVSAAFGSNTFGEDLFLVK